MGKWKEVGGTETVEYFRDGTVSIIGAGGSMGGSYKFVDNDRIKVEMGGLLGALTGPIIAKVVFSDGTLIFTMPDGKVMKYSKVR